jgi:excisionase family DNA binding protein
MLTRRFLTVKEVADLVQVSEVSVRHWIKLQQLRAIDLGREWRIIPRDLEAFLDTHETCAARQPRMRLVARHAAERRDDRLARDLVPTGPLTSGQRWSWSPPCAVAACGLSGPSVERDRGLPAGATTECDLIRRLATLAAPKAGWFRQPSQADARAVKRVMAMDRKTGGGSAPGFEPSPGWKRTVAADRPKAGLANVELKWMRATPPAASIATRSTKEQILT